MNDEKTPENPQIKITSPDPENTKPAPPSYKTEDLIEDHIKTICEDHGMTIEEIRAGIQGLQHHDKRQKFHDVRDRIIKSLVSDEVFGRLTQVDIGKILSMSGASVSHRMRKMGISPVNPRGEFKKVVKRIKSKTTTSRQPIKVKETPVSHLVLNFTDHQETLEKISKVAKDLMREPEAQVLFWLVHSDFEKLEGR